MEAQFYDEAIVKEDLKLLESLWDKGLTFDDFSGSKAVCAADFRIRDWVLQKKFKPDYLAYLFAIRRKRFDVLEWLYEYGVPLTTTLANYAVVHNNIYLLEWFESKKVLPDIVGLNCAIKKNLTETVEWMKIRGIVQN